MNVICGCKVIWLACGDCAKCLWCCACIPAPRVVRVSVPLRRIHGADPWKPGAMGR